MPRPDFFSQIQSNDKTENLQSALIRLIEKVMRHPNTASEKRHKLARLRAYIDIQLKNF